VIIERIALSLVQLGKDADELTRDIATKDAAMEKLRSIVDGERARSTLEGVESLRGGDVTDALRCAEHEEHSLRFGNPHDSNKLTASVHAGRT
jgi:hypothetical protein